MSAPGDELEIARAVSYAREYKVAEGADRYLADIASGRRSEALDRGAIAARGPLNELEVAIAILDRGDETIMPPGTDAEKGESDVAHRAGRSRATERRCSSRGEGPNTD